MSTLPFYHPLPLQASNMPWATTNAELLNTRPVYTFHSQYITEIEVSLHYVLVKSHLNLSYTLSRYRVQYFTRVSLRGTLDRHSKHNSLTDNSH